jgi:hypothetical protein
MYIMQNMDVEEVAMTVADPMAAGQRDAIADPPAFPATLAEAAKRQDLFGPAISLFIKISDHWGLSVKDRQTLLGGISRQTYNNWKQGGVKKLSHDRLERLSLIFGVHKGLQMVFAEDAAGVRWLKAANRDVPFAGQSPLERMLHGAMDDLYVVRRYLDAWRDVCQSRSNFRPVPGLRRPHFW